MIATLTANPCIDKTVTLEHFDVYKMNRVKVLRTDACGKGINVSTALMGLGVPTCCTGFDFSDGTPSPLQPSLAAQGIPAHFLTVPGKLRTCTKIFDQSLKHTIEINEFGPEVSPEDGERLIRLVADTARQAQFFTLSGSLPKGLGNDFYYRCAKAISAAAPQCRVVVDAEKTLLMKALEAAPAFIKPNIHEFQDTFQCTVSSLSELDREAKKIIGQYGLEFICVSMGANGAFIASDSKAYTCNAAQVEVRSIQGAGDSLVAGMCAALCQGLPLPDVLHHGVVAAGASISREGTQLCTREDVDALLSQNLNITRIR